MERERKRKTLLAVSVEVSIIMFSSVIRSPHSFIPTDVEGDEYTSRKEEVHPSITSSSSSSSS